jgi:hypothetical protein
LFLRYRGAATPNAQECRRQTQTNDLFHRHGFASKRKLDAT